MVGRRLANGPREHQEGATSLGTIRGVAAEGWSGYVCLGKFLPHGGTSGADIWGGYLDAVGYNVEKLEGVHVGLLWQVKGKKARRQKYRSWGKAVSGRILQ